MAWRLFVAGCLAVLAGAAQAATLKVDRRGTTPGAYPTLAAAAAAVHAGDTIELVPGSGPYRETLDIGQAGTAAAPITVEGHGELITGFEPFQFTWNPATLRWEYVLPAPLANPNPSVPSVFRHLIAYRGQRLLMNNAGNAFTSDVATLSEDGLRLVLGNASPTDGWEIGTRAYALRVNGSAIDSQPTPWFHVYRNLRLSGAINDGVNLHGAGTNLRFENIESFQNFDEGFSAHDSIQCSLDGARLWGNDNGLYNQSRATVAMDANNVMAYANLGTGISMRQGVTRLSNSAAWDNGVINLALGGTLDTRSVYTFQDRSTGAPFLAYQESQGQAPGADYPYTYQAYWQGQPADAEHQAYVQTGDAPATIAVSSLPPFALPYSDWRYAVFGAADIAQPAISGETADPDTDGRTNLQEYTDGSSPLVADAAATRVWVEVPDATARRVPLEAGRFEIHRGGRVNTSLTVFYAMSGTAVAGTHYVAPTGLVTFAPGATVATVTVDPIASSGGGSWKKIKGKWVWVPDPAATGGPLYAVLRVAADSAYRLGPDTGTVTLDPVDSPIVNLEVVDDSASELRGEDGLFRLRRSGPTDQSLSVAITVGGTATSGADYTALPNPVVFGAGVSAVDIPVTAIVDTVQETVETVQISVQPNAAYRLGAAIGVVRIEGLPLPTVMLSATDGTATEAPGNPGEFTVSRASAGAALIAYYGVGGTATNGVDYQTLVGGVLLPDGATSATIPILPIDDTVAESTESVVLTLLDDPNYVVGSTKTGTVSISNHVLPTVNVNVTDSSASEAPGNPGTFSISRSGVKTVPLMVNFTLGGTATPGSDYQAIGGSVEIPVGSSAAVVNVQPLADLLVEGTETVTLTVTASPEYLLGTTVTGTVNVNDVPPPTVSLSVPDATASEAGNNTAQVTVSRTGSRVDPLTVGLLINGTATEGVDYAAIGPSIVIPAGAASAAIVIAPSADTLIEGTESVTIALQSQPYYVNGATSTASVNITDVAPVNVSVAAVDAIGSEDAGDTASFLLTRSGSTVAPMAVDVQLGGTATEGGDYATISRPVQIPAGATSALVTIVPITDAEAESGETVILTVLAGAAYLPGANASATVMLYDTAPLSLTLTASDASAAEGDGNTGTFRLDLSRALDHDLPVPVQVGGTATPGADYPALPSIATIPAGATSLELVVSPITDTAAEPSETVILTLLPSSDYLLGGSTSGTVTIANAALPVVSVATTDGSASESPGNGGLFTVSRTGSKTAALSVTLSFTGSATRGEDYADPGSVVVIPAGSSSATVAIAPLPDALVEGTEIATLTVVAGSGYWVGGTTSGTVNIADVPLPTVGVVAADASASEAPGDPGSFTVSRSGSRTLAMSVSVSVSGSAVEGQDFSSIGTTVVIPAGAASVSVPVLPLSDAETEPTESVVLRVEPLGYYAIGVDAQATVSITDAPPAP